jgi:hypothetical protein
MVELYDVRPMTKADEKDACVEIYPKAKAWLLRNRRVLKKPFPVKGSLSLFNLEVKESNLKF